MSRTNSEFNGNACNAACCYIINTDVHRMYRKYGRAKTFGNHGGSRLKQDTPVDHYTRNGTTAHYS